MLLSPLLIVVVIVVVIFIYSIDFNCGSYNCQGSAGGSPGIGGLHGDDIVLLGLQVQFHPSEDGTRGVHGEQVRVCLQSIADFNQGAARGGEDSAHHAAFGLVLLQAEVVGGARKGQALLQAHGPDVDEDGG